ncbi:DUF998 domain-containing protein [Microbacterium sp. H1-D42]|uniref:DUF998 domain-containing protein n=1 Tax=Microbacterium sp. H1-D42 TaxID=2925844 RepID=UPI001F52EFA8|nr:DUF998 domain-containing protein [Microbacterium sp. H1-D42]UNK69952.1 DUF998 domain-containing protein [Microbacterium sp. H1-D42]
MSSRLRRTFESVSDALRRPARTTEALETIAVLVGAAVLVIGFLVSLLLFWGTELSISGSGSIGVYAAGGGAIVAAIAFVLGRVAVRPARSDHRGRGVQRGGGVHLRWYDLVAIAVAYASVALLGWLGIAQLLELSFIGAPVYAFPGAVLVGVAFALTAYVAFLGSASLTPMSLSLALAIFLVIGAFSSMLESSDPGWWRNNLSALGMTSNQAAPAFNLTLIVSGVMITTIARYATAGLPVDTPLQRRRRTQVRAGLVLVGVLLACVGVFPVDRFFLLHNTFATGMAVIYAVVVCALPWMLPTLPRVFFAVGYVFVAVIVLLGVFFATGYYNLTAVELIAGILIFTWIILFLRTAGAVSESRISSPESQESASERGNRASESQNLT